MLNLYLKKIGLTTGPLKRNTSYSRLEVMRKYLLNIPQFEGQPIFLLFGNALHEVFLENKFDSYKKLTKTDQLKVDKMVKRLRAHPVVMKLMENSVREEKLYSHFNKVEFAFILDIDKRPKEKTGADLKTTACVTREDCLTKVIEYGYVKQNLLYKKLAKLNNFYFIFISKKEPHDIFIISAQELIQDEKYALKEVEFLTYFYKHYGKFSVMIEPKEIII